MKVLHQFSQAARNGAIPFEGAAWAMHRLWLMVLVFLSASLMVVACSANGPQAGMEGGQACGQGPGTDSAKFGDLQGLKSDAYVFGETHGTNESPEQFLRFVCSFIQSANTPPIVGVEVSVASALAVKESLPGDAIEAKDGRQAFANSAFWKNSRDGRSSRANYLLLTRLFALEKAGKVVVVGFDRRVTGNEPFGQTASDFILALRNEVALSAHGAGKKNPTVIVLTGNRHAKPDGSPLSLTDALVRGGLATQVISLEHAGGTAWVCVQGRCGPTEFPAGAACGHEEPTRLRRNDGGNAQEEVICVGPITSSPPEVAF